MNPLNKMLITLNVLSITFINYYPFLSTQLNKPLTVLGAQTSPIAFKVETEDAKLKKNENSWSIAITSNQLLASSTTDQFKLSPAYAFIDSDTYQYQLSIKPQSDGIFRIDLTSIRGETTQLYAYSKLSASGAQIAILDEQTEGCYTEPQINLLIANITPTKCISKETTATMDLVTLIIDEKEHKINKIVQSDLVAMLQAAYERGIRLDINSAYRDYETQQKLINRMDSTVGVERTEELVAKPGHSEHHLGTAIDFTSPEVGTEQTPTFGDTNAYKWLIENAWEYGFALSYPDNNSNITGYTFEPWHWRYIGKEHASILKAHPELTLTQYLTMVENSYILN